MAFVVLFYELADGAPVIRKRLDGIRERERQAWAPISTGLELLAEYGADTRLNKFKRLKHVDAAKPLWELRAQGRPAYRLLFMGVPDEEAYLILEVVRKDDMSKDPQKYIQNALDRYEQWLREVWSRVEED